VLPFALPAIAIGQSLESAGVAVVAQKQESPHEAGNSGNCMQLGDNWGKATSPTGSRREAVGPVGVMEVAGLPTCYWGQH